MNFYESEINRIRSIAYANKAQLNTIIQVKAYIDSNYDADVNLDLLSKVRFVSKYHLLISSPFATSQQSQEPSSLLSTNKHNSRTP